MSDELFDEMEGLRSERDEALAKVAQLTKDLHLASKEQERLRTEINSAKYQGEQATLKRLHGLFYVLAHDPTALAKAIKAAGTIYEDDG